MRGVTFITPVQCPSFFNNLKKQSLVRNSDQHIFLIRVFKIHAKFD